MNMPTISSASSSKLNPVRFGVEPKKPIDTIRDHLKEKKVSFSEIFEGVQGNRKTLDIFVEDQAQVGTVLNALRDLEGVTAHADNNKVNYYKIQVGVWVNTKFELFKPGK